MGPGGLVSTGGAAHPAVTSMDTWRSNYQTTVCVSIMGEVQVGLLVLTPSPWGVAHSHLRGTNSLPGGFANTGS